MIYNAKIIKTSLGVTDRGLSSFIEVEYERGNQSFGEYSLKHYSSLGLWVNKILYVTDISEWERLKNTYVRIDVEDQLIVGIGNIIKTRWFYPKKDLI